jgi:hypothetical protein
MKQERRNADDRRHTNRRKGDRRRGSPPVMQDRRTRFSFMYFVIVLAFVLGLRRISPVSSIPSSRPRMSARAAASA